MIKVIYAIDLIIHKVPILPKRLQGTLLDKIWSRLSD